MLIRIAVALACSLVPLAGCGNARTPPPDLSRAQTPSGTHEFRFANAGISFRAPANWPALPGQSPLVATVGSGRALVAVWRYPRTEPLPATPAALEAARLRLLEAARARYQGLQLIRSRALSVDGSQAVELDAFERIAGADRRVRSLHAYAFGAELVIEEYAPPAVFRAVDHEVFSPLKRSLRLFPAGA